MTVQELFDAILHLDPADEVLIGTFNRTELASETKTLGIVDTSVEGLVILGDSGYSTLMETAQKTLANIIEGETTT